jgi:DNA-binding response OmpR family regulator
MTTDNNTLQKRALVVDDDETVVEHVAAALRRAGYTVETAGDGLSALAKFRANAFDAVVCDIRMPKLSGISFLKNLRLGAQTACRVVMLSSLDDRTIQREAIDAGAVAYLVKPASSKALIEAVTGISTA